MVQIPQEYEKRIIDTFGKTGEEWLNNIDSLIKKYKDMLEIQDINYLTHSMNLIFERIF